MIAVPVILRTLSLRGAKAKGTKDLTAPATVSVGHALRACSLDHALAPRLSLSLWGTRSARARLLRLYLG